MTRPSFALAVAALRVTDARFPWIGPTPEEADIADVLELTEASHVPSAYEPDDRGRWGRCTGCAAPWPCTTWTYGEDIAVQFLGRAADRVAARARQALSHPAPGGRAPALPDPFPGGTS